MSKKPVKSAPELSQLPMPGDQSPVIIDLPDGQKLVVGNLANGSVIEVATWRGTGRPDSRTSRLMLGMSNGAAADPAVEKAHEKSGASKKDELFTKIVDAFKKLTSLAKKSLKAVKPKQQALKSDSVESTKNSEKPLVAILPSSEPVQSDNTEVDEWIANLLKKSEIKAGSTQVKEATKKSASKKAAPQKRAVTKKSATPKKTGSR